MLYTERETFIAIVTYIQFKTERHVKLKDIPVALLLHGSLRNDSIERDRRFN